MGARSRSGSEPSADETGLMGLAIFLRTPLARRFSFDYIQYSHSAESQLRKGQRAIIDVVSLGQRTFWIINRGLVLLRLVRK